MATTAGQGMVYTSDTAKSQLLSSNRDYYNRLTWQNLYTSNNVAAQQAENSLVKSYTDASASAYVSYLQNQNALKNSSIVGSGKQSLMNDAYTSWQSTLSSYQSSLSSGYSSISESLEEANTIIDTALEEQADYTAEYVNAHYSYLEALFEQYENGENTLFDEGSQWYKYLTTDEDGNVSLKSWDDLTAAALDENGEYTSLFDEDRNLTIAGVDFFDQLENQLANEGGYSWGQYLSETNEDLYNWANSYNPYNYTQDGTNAGTMRTMFGMMSTDYAYSFAERFGGLTSAQIDEMFSEFQTSYDEIISKAEGEKYTIGDMSDLASSIQSMADELGITSDLEKEMGMSFESLIEALQSYYDASSTDGERVLNVLARIGVGAATGVVAGGVTGGVIGAGVGSAVTGTAGAVAGGVVGAVAGLISGIVSLFSSDKTNKANLSSAQELFNQLLASMTSYSAYKQRQRQIDFNNSIRY